MPAPRTPTPSLLQPRPVSKKWISANAVAGEFLGDVGLDRLRLSNIEIAAGDIVNLDLGQAAAIERVCPFGIDPQCGVIVRNGLARLPGFQVYHRPAVERVRIA